MSGTYVNSILATMEAKEDGLYWFDVSVEQQLITRVPYRLVYQRIAHQS